VSDEEIARSARSIARAIDSGAYAGNNEAMKAIGTKDFIVRRAALRLTPEINEIFEYNYHVILDAVEEAMEQPLPVICCSCGEPKTYVPPATDDRVKLSPRSEHCTCMADAYCKVHGNQPPATDDKQERPPPLSVGWHKMKEQERSELTHDGSRDAMTPLWEAEREQLETEVFTALGEASMQWSPNPSGVFKLNECNRIGKELCGKINAALSAAIKPYNDGWLDQAARDSIEIVRLETELAAEREKNKQADIELDRLDRKRSQLRQQLAAERNETEKYKALAAERWNQLAAELEKLKTLVEALELVRKALCSSGGLREVTDIIDDALANVKDGK
jgi:hypothetical protein